MDAFLVLLVDWLHQCSSKDQSDPSGSTAELNANAVAAVAAEAVVAAAEVAVVAEAAEVAVQAAVAAEAVAVVAEVAVVVMFRNNFLFQFLITGFICNLQEDLRLASMLPRRHAQLAQTCLDHQLRDIWRLSLEISSNLFVVR